ncbi:hypothetical protein AVEN_66538-1 [Araneus ventricosus]|uniref:Uncharacterized protein n=1 Tax=Araneus ventricosus TaxID=182803 RepID=A0A4Y2EC09_ARAVE|nr:hypothetical protein AVEN_66538-1 [Araneus ventricosus]
MTPRTRPAYPGWQKRRPVSVTDLPSLEEPMAMTLKNLCRRERDHSLTDLRSITVSLVANLRSSRGCCGLVSGCRPQRRRVRNPIPLKIRRVLGLLHVKTYVKVKRPSAGVVRKFGEGVSAQVSSSSSDRKDETLI